MGNGGVGWLELILAAVVAIFGKEGVTSLITIFRDRKANVRTADLEEDKVQETWWRERFELQKTQFIDPLTAKVDALDRKIDQLEKDIAATRTRYWKAVKHIRALYAYIRDHPSHDESTPPAPPVDLLDDI